MQGKTLPDFFFTEKDLKIYAGSQDRDLLGLQPIWSFYGNNLIPPLTSRSGNAHHLSASLLMAHAYSVYAEEMGARSMNRVQAMLVLEQIYGYSHFAAREGSVAENFPGVLRAKTRYQNDEYNTCIGPDKKYHLLDGQASQGVYARYATPMRRMKLIEHQRSNVFWPEEWNVDLTYGSECKRIIRAFTQALNNFSQGKDALFFGQVFPRSSDLSDLFHRCTGVGGFSENQKAFWNQCLGVITDDLLQALSESRTDSSVESAIRTLYTNGADDNNRLESVITSEEYLKYLSGSFYLLLKVTDFSKAESLLKESYPDFEDRLADSQEKFKTLPHPGGDGGKRLEKMSCFSTKASEFLRDLTAFHHKLQHNRAVLTRGPGTSLETTRPDWRDDEATAEGLFKQWGRDYYVYSLWNLTKGLEGEEESR